MLPQYSENEYRERVNDRYDEYNFNVAEVVEIDSSADDVGYFEVDNDCQLLSVDQRISPRAPAADLYYDTSQVSALAVPEKDDANFANAAHTDFPRIDEIASYHASSSMPKTYHINSSDLQEIDSNSVVDLYSSEELNAIVKSFDDYQNESMFDEFISPISPSTPMDVEFSLSNGSTTMPPQNDILEMGIFPKNSTIIEENNIRNNFLEKASLGSPINNNEKKDNYLFDNDIESYDKSFTNMNDYIQFEHCNITTETTKQEETRIDKALSLSSTSSPTATQRKSSANTIDLSDSPMDEETKKTKNNNAKILTIFPKPPAKGGICITSEDYMCLAAGEYLNDIIIDFYLKYLQEEVLSTKDRDRTHIFSSHFYTRLAKISHSADECEDITLAEKRYAGVHRWTKNINIFEKDFVIVPINQHCHWYLAIICFPGLVLVDDHEFHTSGKSYNQQRPCILIFDSLSNGVKNKVTRLLKEYLQLECAYKINREKAHEFNSIKTFYPLSPKQTNATDCGLYMLQYVESFFEDPIIQFSSPIKNLSKWFYKSKVIDKRRKIAEIITLLMFDFHDGQSIDLPTINFLDEFSESSCSNSNLFPCKRDIDNEAKRNNFFVDDDGIEIFVPKSKIAPIKSIKSSKNLFEECKPNISTKKTALDNDIVTQNKLKLSRDNLSKSVNPNIVENMFTNLRNKKKNLSATDSFPNHKNLKHCRENCSKMINDNKYFASSFKGNSSGIRKINVSSSEKKSGGISDHTPMSLKPTKRKLYTQEKKSELANFSPITQDKFYHFDFDSIKNESGIPHVSSFNVYKTLKIKKKII